MWFALAIAAAAFVVATLFAPKPKIENARASTLDDFSFPRSNEGDPLPIIKGTTKLLSPNTTWMGDFRTEAITKKVKTGLFSSKRQTVGYRYFIGLDLALCLGPNVTLKRVWFGDDVAWEGNISGEGSFSVDLPNFYGGNDNGNGGIKGTLMFYGGSMDQTQDSYLASKQGDPDFPAYHGVSHAVLRNFYVGNSPNIDAIAFELQCFSNKLGLPGGKNVMPNGLDENPVETLYDLYTTFWGKLGVDPANIDIPNFTEAALRIYAENNGYSLSLANANTGSDLTKEIIRQINAILYQDIETAKIRIKLIRADYDEATLPVLRPSSVVELTSYSKQLWDETFNQVRVKFKNRENNYQDGSALWQDFANINMQQRVRSTEISFPGVFRGDLANELAAREGSQLNVPLFQCELDADRTVSELRPGDCFILHWPEYGIKRTIMRIRRFDTGELANGKIAVVCTQDEFSSDNVVFSTPSTSQWSPPDLTPDQIAQAVVFAAPNFFKLTAEGSTAPGERVFALARKPDAQSQSYDINTSLDLFITSAVSGDQVQYSGAGVLFGAYPNTAGIVDGFDDSLGIVVNEMDGVFAPESHSDAEIKGGGQNLIYVAGEIMAYRTATPVGVNSYRLTNIRRGLLDTAVLSHPNSTPVFFLSSIDGMADAIFNAGDSPHVKLQDRAPQGVFPLEAAAVLGPVPMDSRTLRPQSPVGTTYEGVRTGTAARSATATVAWKERNRTSTAISFRDDATQAPEAGQDNIVRWRINSGAWTEVIVAGTSTPIDTSTAIAGGLLTVEVRARRDGLQSRVADTFTIALT